ncbi:MAG: TldD/PmbA family protein, partial [Thermoplasmata archaeon]
MAEQLLDLALDTAQASGIVYADVRVVSPQRYLHLAVRNGAASALTSSLSAGIGVRVRTARAWGFAGTSEITSAGARSAARLAVRLAKTAGRTAPEPLRLTEEDGPRDGRYVSEVREDPFEVSREEVVGILAEAERRLHSSPEVTTGLASFQAWDEAKSFRSSEGASFRSRIVHVGAGVSATAVRGAMVQTRSSPAAFGGDYRQAGFEFVRGLDLDARAETAGKEVVQLLDAPVCPTGTTTLVLGSSQLALQVHESVGHAVELDRIYGSEAAYAGTSWVTPAGLGSLAYGSELMSVVADATEPGGLGTFGWDDEGVPAQRV